MTSNDNKSFDDEDEDIDTYYAEAHENEVKCYKKLKYLT